MKADFEKGTKVCSRCKRELAISEFWKDKHISDGLACACKECRKKCTKECADKMVNTFGRKGKNRGNSGRIKRDYELTEEQLKKRNKRRKYNKNSNKMENPQGILIWYDGKLDSLSSDEYKKIMIREYDRQKRCAICGYIGRTKPSEHFLFDFDLEQMLKCDIYCSAGNNRKYITKWWKGKIRHWTVNDGIWKE